MDWAGMATYVSETYGMHVDWQEEFYICPECGEPIYKADYPTNDNGRCPVCEMDIYDNDEEPEEK